jgi:hypothetical protein
MPGEAAPRATWCTALFLGAALTFSIQANADTFRVKETVSGGIQNMRSGPGVRHAVIIAIPAGTEGVEQLGGCREPDDNSSRYIWCRFRWGGKEGWISLNGLEKTDRRGSFAEAPKTVNALQLAKAGILWNIYDSVSKAMREGKFADYVHCPYQGEGFTISLSPALVAQYKERGFTLRTMCLALASDRVKFDPSNGRPLPRYQLPGYGSDPEYRFPFYVPDCFSKLQILNDRHFEIAWRPIGCEMKYDPTSGSPISGSARVELFTGGAAGDAPDESRATSGGVTSSSELGNLVGGQGRARR